MLEWLIVGGGIHGTHLSRVLAGAAGVPVDRIGVIDATGMTYLRSPAVHNLDLEAHALRRFAKRGPGKRVARFVPPYDRPGLAFFRAHVEDVVDQGRLRELRVRGRAIAIERGEVGFRVETEHGVLEARRLVLAVGMGEQPCWPEWARALGAVPDRVTHVFAPGFERAAIGAGRIAVIGAGISGAQLAATLADRGGMVTLISRHPARVHRFDSDPEWLGPRGLEPFARERSLAARRAVIARARNRGSMPPEVAGRIANAVARASLRFVVDEIASASVDANGVALLTKLGARLEVDQVILATGFDAHRPGGRFLDEAIDRLGLPCAACGYPVLRPSLEWAPGLFVTGPLAELELGPAARNIAGARAAGARLRRSA